MKISSLKHGLMVGFLLSYQWSMAQIPIDSLLPVRGFCIGAPQPSRVDEFVQFIEKELAPRQVNTLILRVEFNYEFKSHPELHDSVALSRRDV